MRLLPYRDTVPDLPVAPGWPHADTAAALMYAASGAPTWLIVDDDGRIAGECGAKSLPDADGAVEIGYGLAGPSRGRGLGTRAVGALVEELTLTCGARLIHAEVTPDNVASRRLLERLGFTALAFDERYVRYTLVVGRPGALLR